MSSTRSQSPAALSGQLSGTAIREKFVRFFESHGHRHLPSASLVPGNPTVLLTPAGMLPFVPVFLGIEPPPNPPRAVTSQKCARVSGKASDLSYVGRTPRHHTFFEMLGNFSFGDYFKAEVIPWAWRFLTEELGLPKDRLVVTVHHSDDEARQIWHQQCGIPLAHIVGRDDKDNFWGPPGPTGPCGPCSEIFYDFQPELMTSPAHQPWQDGQADLLDADRFIEVWNLVFMQLFQNEAGERSPLEKKNVDTGMGLERIAMVVQGVQNTFETDLLFPLVAQVGKAAGVAYKQSEATDVALKIVADHIRCLSFAIADGIIPSNEGRGYVIRMILRRAVRTGKQYLGFQQPFLFKLAATVRDMYQSAYPELNTQYNTIVETIQLEEKRFFETLERGSRMLDEIMETTRAAGRTEIDGEAAFRLYDTYGFPLELTEDIAQEQGLTVNQAAYDTAMQAQKEQARAAKKDTVLVSDQVYARILEQVGPSQFEGYDTLTLQATVKALIVDGESVPEVSGTNRRFEAILDRTPFYPESGGQVGDRGTFNRHEGHHGLTVVVNDCRKVGDLLIHDCLFDNGGSLKAGETLIAEVEPVARQQTALHHTATHLLHAALKHVLGDQVAQAGSKVSPEGARFDFTFNRAPKPQELNQVEYWMNQWIRENVPRETMLMDLEAAKAAGAVAMFDEKYGDTVRVIGYGAVSKELCGGTHISSLGELGAIKIVGEGAIASGVRRVEIVAGEAAYKAFKQAESQLLQAASALKATPEEVPERIQKLQAELKSKEKALQHLQEAAAAGEAVRLAATIPADKPVLLAHLPGQSADALKAMAEKLLQVRPSLVLALAGDSDGKVSWVTAASKDWVDRGVHAGNLVKAAATLCGGGGGGKPGFAQAGGRDATKISDALRMLESQLSETMKAG
ncbi:MAG: alanine--tRNA ligase [Candidatus Melainabacteria bacterium]